LTTRVHAPLTGKVVELSRIPDPVFSQAMVGPGCAIDPTVAAGATARSPVDGTVASLHPHAFVVVTADGTGILVHLGLDTVELDGAGFERHVREGDAVAAGQPVVTWNPGDVRRSGRSAVSPVIALDTDPATVNLAGTVADYVLAGEALFVTTTPSKELAG